MTHTLSITEWPTNLVLGSGLSSSGATPSGRRPAWRLIRAVAQQNSSSSKLRIGLFCPADGARRGEDRLSAHEGGQGDLLAVEVPLRRRYGRGGPAAAELALPSLDGLGAVVCRRSSSARTQVGGLKVQHVRAGLGGGGT